MDVQAEKTQLIDLHTASTMAGVSPATVRRWVRAGKVRDRRAPGDRRSPIVVSEHDVRSYLLNRSAPAVQPDRSNGNGDRARVPNVTSLLIKELQADKARLQNELDQVRVELAGVRQQLVDKQARIEALERELNGGVRGLLRGAARRMWR